MLIVLKSLKSSSESSASYWIGLVDHTLAITNPMASVSQRTRLSLKFESKISYEMVLVKNYQDISLMLTKGERGFASKIASRCHFRASIIKKISWGEHAPRSP